jgi:thiol:disulfide interchange protein DsbC
MFRFCLLATLLLSAAAVQAEDDAHKAVIDAMHAVAPQAKIESIAESSLPGFFAVVVEGHVIYVSGDGKYLIEGKVYDIKKHADLSDERLSVLRKEGIAKIPAEKRLVFAPPNPKYKVTVFTDVDCPYCRQFHKQIADYNQLGIEVDYVLFPLNIHPGADKKAVSVWCSADRNTAYTAAMNGQTLPSKTCDNPIAELTSVAMAMGLNGTPAILAEDGSQIGGYLPPQELAQRLSAINAASKAPN